jgi:hypothetical protein
MPAKCRSIIAEQNELTSTVVPVSEAAQDEPKLP